MLYSPVSGTMLCASISPGVTDTAETTGVPAGILIEVRGPTATIFPSFTSTTPSSIGFPPTGKSRPARIAADLLEGLTDGAWGGAAGFLTAVRALTSGLA